MRKNIKIIKCYSSLEETVVLDFMPCKEADYNFIDDFYEKTNTELLRIYQTDYDKFIVPYLNKVYPVIDPCTLKSQATFDVCFDNLLSKEDWQKWLALLTFEVALNTIEKEKEFYEAFILWHHKQLNWADMLMIEGNQ